MAQRTAQRTAHRATLTDDSGEILSAEEGHAWNSTTDKGLALVRAHARATGEPYLRQADTATGSPREGRYTIAWEGERSGTRVWVTVERVGQE